MLRVKFNDLNKKVQLLFICFTLDKKQITYRYKIAYSKESFFKHLLDLE